jgi:hypothetical protein
MRPGGAPNKKLQTTDSEPLAKQLIPLLLHEQVKRLK